LKMGLNKSEDKQKARPTPFCDGHHILRRGASSTLQALYWGCLADRSP
jgi:hypothetical protein